MVDSIPFFYVAKCVISYQHTVVLNFFNTSSIRDKSNLIHVVPNVDSNPYYTDELGLMNPNYLPRENKTIAELGEGFKAVFTFDAFKRLTRFSRVRAYVYFRTSNDYCYLYVDSTQMALTTSYCFDLGFNVTCIKQQDGCSIGDFCENYKCNFTNRNNLDHLKMVDQGKIRFDE